MLWSAVVDSTKGRGTNMQFLLRIVDLLLTRHLVDLRQVKPIQYLRNSDVLIAAY